MDRLRPENDRQLLVEGEEETEEENDLRMTDTLTRSLSNQSNHYVLTFENGFQDGSDSEVEELTKSLGSLSDREESKADERWFRKKEKTDSSDRSTDLELDDVVSVGEESNIEKAQWERSGQQPETWNPGATKSTSAGIADQNGAFTHSDKNNNSRSSGTSDCGPGGRTEHREVREVGTRHNSQQLQHCPPLSPANHHPHLHHQHAVYPLRDTDSELSDEGILDRRPSAHSGLQIPIGDSDSDVSDVDSHHRGSSGSFVHIREDGSASVRSDTPNFTPRGSARTVISFVDSNPDSGSESGTFVRPKPLSGSTTAMFGSVESLNQPQSLGEVQYRHKRYTASEYNIPAAVSSSGGQFSSSFSGPLPSMFPSGPVEGFFGNVNRRRAFHSSMQRLSLGAMPASHNLGVAYMSDEDSGHVSEGRRGFVSNKKQGVNRRWSLAHADTNSLDDVRLLQTQLDKTERELKKKENAYQQELSDLRKDNERQSKIIEKNLTLGPEAKIEATMQHEITRMTSENLDLREVIDKQNEQIRKLKKMLKIYAKRLKEGDGLPKRWSGMTASMSVSSDMAAEIAAELEKDDHQGEKGAAMGATLKHKERTYMGMLEYRREDEAALIKNLIIDLKPKVAAGLIPGLPSYVLFMCVRHTDYINDDDKVKALLTGTINGIKKVVKKHSDDMERVTLWLANTCRLMHTLKQYSGEKQFQVDNQPKQNEMCLRNFDLSEYRQVFSDLAIWIYQTLIKLMQELIQPNIVPAVLEHEAISGLTPGSKPTGMRGRSSSNARELEDEKDSSHSLDALMRTLNTYMRFLTQHAVDPELVKQIARQLYYYIGAGALNNLLLRKDMCNWSKGMQIRYNLSHMEQWLRDNRLTESGAQVSLEPIIQAAQLLQARKTDADVDSICDMSSKLTAAQITKILTLYTPVDNFEERVPMQFIRSIQQRLKQRPEAQSSGASTLLMDTKFTFPVTFPFNPSSIMLDSIEVPEQLHLGFLKKL